MIWLVWLLGLFSIIFALMGIGVLLAEFLPGESTAESKEERARIIFSGFACLFLAISSGGYVLMRVLPPPELPSNEVIEVKKEPEIKIGDTIMYLANKRKKLQFEQINDTGVSVVWYSPVTNKTYFISKDDKKVTHIFEGQKVSK